MSSELHPDTQATSEQLMQLPEIKRDWEQKLLQKQNPEKDLSDTLFELDDLTTGLCANYFDNHPQKTTVPYAVFLMRNIDTNKLDFIVRVGEARVAVTKREAVAIIIEGEKIRCTPES